jgi:hypothetical protein
VNNENDVEWRRFEILRASLASAGRSQARFVAGLLGFLSLLWGWHYMRPSEFSIQILGTNIKADGLWTIAPAVLTVLVLGLIGSMNIMGPIWKRLRDCTAKLNEVFFWTDLDPNKTMIDFFTYLTVKPEGPVEATDLPREEKRFRWAVFSYPLVILIATVTTILADYPTASCRFRFYVYTLAGLQALFSIRIWYRSVCKFFGIRKARTEI